MKKEEHKLHSCREFKKYGSSYARHKPRKSLEGFVSYYFVSECSSNDGTPFTLKLVPDGSAELYWHRCADFDYEIAKGANRAASNFFLAFPVKNIALIRASLPVYIIGVKFRPHGLFALTTANIGELTNATVSASEIWGRAAEKLSKAIASSVDGAEAIGHIEDFLEAELSKNEKRLDIDTHNFISGIVDHAIELKGNMSVSEIADQFGLCERQIERKFKERIGMSPKSFLRVVRFNACLDELRKNRTDTTITILHSCGYYDQTHFIKEFKHFAELLPSEFLQWMKSLGLR